MSHVDFRGDSVEPCTHDGRFKVAPEYEDGRTTKLYCRGHADDWLRMFPGGRLIEPRNVLGDVLPCKGDWPLPGAVP